MLQRMSKLNMHSESMVRSSQECFIANISDVSSLHGESSKTIIGSPELEKILKQLKIIVIIPIFLVCSRFAFICKNITQFLHAISKLLFDIGDAHFRLVLNKKKTSPLCLFFELIEDGFV